MSFAFAIGKFDALHRGHRALIEAAADLGDPALLQFSGMAEVLGWTKRAPLVPQLHREDLLKSWSHDVGVAIQEVSIPFNQINELSPKEFITYLREAFDFSALITGDNFRFGHKRSGDVQTLKQLGQEFDFAVHTVSALLHAGKAISSSRIRASINEGYMHAAEEMLGRPYELFGIVGRGEQRGRTIGFPTANIQHIENLIPASGVYAARVQVQSAWHAAAVNIGHLPSISADRSLSVEAHILDWQGDCYDAVMRVQLVERLREEMKFDGLDALKAQIGKDVKRVREILLKD